jgi:heme exporter protein D
MNLSEFLHMGGYAPYVWSCYGLTAIVLVGMEWAGRRQLQLAREKARRRAEMGAQMAPAENPS